MAAINMNKICKYGAKCYRKNPQHFVEYSHPEQCPSKRSRELQGEDDVAVPEPPKKQARLSDLGKQDEVNRQQVKEAVNSERNASLNSDDEDVDDDTLVKACQDASNASDVTQKTSFVNHTEPDTGECLDNTQVQTLVAESDCQTPEYDMKVNVTGTDPECQPASDHLADTSSITDPEGQLTSDHRAGTSMSLRDKSDLSKADNVTSATVSDSAHTSHQHKNDDDDEELLSPKESIRRKFLVDMPEDFYEFWEYAKSVNSVNPSAAFASTLNLHLVGPYDVLAGKCTRIALKKRGLGRSKPNYLLHYRYYYDPPEFMTVLRGDENTLFHLGYFRDDPKEMPVFVASNSAAVDCVIKPKGSNIFSAVSSYIDEEIKRDPTNKNKLLAVSKSLKAWAEKKNIPLDVRSQQMKDRDKKVVTKCFHGAGLVVPVDKNGVGYRELPETPADLKKILKKIIDSKTEEEKNASFDALMEIITLVQFANDECDYGEGLELGLNLFSYGGGEVLHKTVQGLLPLAYQLLGRHEYASVIEAHLLDRRRGADVNQLK